VHQAEKGKNGRVYSTGTERKENPAVEETNRKSMNSRTLLTWKERGCGTYRKIKGGWGGEKHEQSEEVWRKDAG